MKGTEKQVKWAEDIKASTYKILEGLEIRHQNVPGKAFSLYTPSDCNYVSLEAIAAVRGEMDTLYAKIDSAAMIIDKRNALTSEQWIINHCRDWMAHHGQRELLHR